MPITDPKTLAKLAEYGFEKMRQFRKARLVMLKEYVGRMYGGNSSDGGAPIPVNLMFQAATTLVPNLVYTDPRAKVSTSFMKFRFYANLVELAIDHLLDEIRYKHTLRKVVTDSLFSAGFLKTGITSSGYTLDLDGFLHDMGQPYADRVDPDDMLLDPSARDWDEQRFIGNRFSVDFETLADSGYIPKNKLDYLEGRWETPGESNEASGLSTADNLLQRADSEMRTVDLVEIWLPTENLIVTMPWQANNEVGEVILRKTEYSGPELGPYQMLGYAFVPDNILPVAPASIWFDLHMMANKIARKIGRQADRQKRLLAYQSSAWQDAQDIVDSSDGQTVRVDDVDAIKEVQFGGVPDDSYQYMDWTKNFFSEMAMNIDLLSGSGTSEPTATQSEMLQANSSVRLADMQALVYGFVADSMTRLGFYLHTDPFIELPLVKRDRGVEQQVVYTPDQREGEWYDYNIKVRPYSMSRQDPNVKVRRFLEFAGNVLPAAANAAQMLGPAFNLDAFIRIVGREMGVEELDEIINSEELASMQERMMQAIQAGIPLDQKVLKSIMNPTNSAGSAGPGMKPGQPNPMAALPGGVTPGVETNKRRQETGGELQATYTAGA